MAISYVNLEKLATLAHEISIISPERFSTHGYNANVPRAIVNDIRDVLTAAGIDWRAGCRKYKADRKARLKAYADKQQAIATAAKAERNLKRVV